MITTNPTHNFNAFHDKCCSDVGDKHSFMYQYAIYNNCLQRLLLHYYDVVSLGGFALFWTFTHNDRSLPHSFGFPCVDSRMIRLFTNNLQNWCNRRDVEFKFAFFTEYDSNGIRVVHPHLHSILFFTPRNLSTFDKDSFIDSLYIKLYQYFQGNYYFYKNFGSRDYPTGFTADWFIKRGFKETKSPQIDFPIGMCNSSRNMGLVKSAGAIRYVTKYLLKHTQTYNLVEYNHDIIDDYDSFVIPNFTRIFSALFPSVVDVRPFVTKFLRRMHFKHFFRYKISKNLGLISFYNGNSEFGISPFDPLNPVVNLQVDENKFETFNISSYYFNKAFKQSIRVYKDSSHTDKVYRSFYNTLYSDFMRFNFDKLINTRVTEFKHILNSRIDDFTLTLEDFGLSSPSDETLLDVAYYCRCLRYRLIPRNDDFADFKPLLSCPSSRWRSNCKDYFFKTLKTIDKVSLYYDYDSISETYFNDIDSFPFYGDTNFIYSNIAFSTLERYASYFDYYKSEIAKQKHIDRTDLDDTFVEQSKYY